MRSNSALMTEVMLTDLAEKANIKMRNIGRTGLQAGELKEAFNLYVLASLSIDSEDLAIFCLAPLIDPHSLLFPLRIYPFSFRCPLLTGGNTSRKEGTFSSSFLCGAWVLFSC